MGAQTRVVFKLDANLAVLHVCEITITFLHKSVACYTMRLPLVNRGQRKKL